MANPHVLLAMLPGTRDEIELVRSVAGLQAPSAYLSARGRWQSSGFRLIGPVAVIDVIGPLAHRNDWLFQTYEDIARQLAAALASPDATAIVLNIDSPGGEVAGCAQLGAQLRAAASLKPLHACINDMGASAAYWLASACSQVSATPSSRVGSIGIRSLHVDRSGALEQAGMVVTELYAGDHKIDGTPYAPLTDTAREAFQADIDALYQQFVTAVAAYRGLDKQTVIDTQAAVYAPADARRLGLIDAIESPDAVIARLSKRHGAASARSTSMSESHEYHADAVAAKVSAARDEAFKAGYDKGLAEGEQRGMSAACARIAAILDSPEAQGREAQARKLALTTALTAQECGPILAAAPKIEVLKTETLSDFATHMAVLGNPTVGPDSKPSTETADIAAMRKAAIARLPQSH